MPDNKFYHVRLNTEAYPQLAETGIVLRIATRREGENSSRPYLHKFEAGKTDRVPRYMYEHWCGPLHCDLGNDRDVEKLQDAINNCFKQVYHKKVPFTDKWGHEQEKIQRLQPHEFQPVLIVLTAEEALQGMKEEEKPPESAYQLDPAKLSHNTLKAMVKDMLVEQGMDKGEAHKLTMGMTALELADVVRTGEIKPGTVETENPAPEAE